MRPPGLTARLWHVYNAALVILSVVAIEAANCRPVACIRVTDDRQKAREAQWAAGRGREKNRLAALKAKRDADKARLKAEADKAKGAAATAANNKRRHFREREGARTRARSAREEISILNANLRRAKGAERERLQREIARWRQELDAQQRASQRATEAARKESQAMDDYAALMRRIEERRRRLGG